MTGELVPPTVQDIADDMQKNIREIEAQSRSQLIEKAVLDTANDIVKRVMEKNAATINENMFELIKIAVREELAKMTSFHDLVRDEARKFMNEKYAEIGTPFLDALEAGEKE